MRHLHYALVIMLLPLGLLAQPCSDLFMSEYIEGSSNNKAIEIYNPTASPINLSGYRLVENFNTTGGVNEFALDGMLAPGDVYIIAASAADTVIRALADTLLDFPSAVHYNGDDMVALVNASNDTVDKIGIFNVDPGSGWVVNGVNNGTQDHTLVRMPNIQEGTNDWATGANQWIVYNIDSFDFLGSHTMTACGAIVDTTVGFTPSAGTVAETVGTTTLTLNLNVGSNASTVSVDVSLDSGDPADVDGFSTQTVTFNGSVTENLTVTVTDDTLMEGDEVFTFKLSNPTGNLMLGADTVFTLTISASDQPAPVIPQYSIATVRGVNTNGAPDSLGVVCQLSGTVLGVNYNPGGLSFTIHDGTAGIGVFAPSSVGDFGYTVMEGDSVIVVGEIDEFNGQGQIAFLDTVYLVGTGAVPSPMVVTSLDESTESELIRMNGMTIVQLLSSTGAGDTYEITNGTDTVQMRIDADIVFNRQAPTGVFDVVGIGGQFDFSSPYDEAYNVIPRSEDDIFDIVGIEEAELVRVMVSPNPASAMIFVKAEGNQLIKEVALYDLAGKLVKTENTFLGANANVDVSKLNSGVYILQVTFAEGNSINTKVLKQ